MRAPVRTMLRRGLWSPGGAALVISGLTLVTVHADTATPSPSPDPNAPATSPDAPPRLIFGCANPTGDVRVLVPPPVTSVNPPGSVTCTKDEVLIAWNQKGRAGPPGATGKQGDPGPKGADGKNATLDTGSVQVLQSFQPQLAQLRDTLVGLQPTPGGINGLAEFTSSGQISVPDNVRNVLVEAWGGGGGGSGATDASDVSRPCFGGAGGGAGEYVRSIVPVPPHRANTPAVLTVDLGTGGAGGTAAAGGTDGRPSKVSVVGGETLVAEGGLGGLAATPATPGGAGGSGGNGPAKANVIIRKGGPGLPGTTTAAGPPPVALTPPPVILPRPVSPADAGSPLASIDRILKSLTLLPGVPVIGDQRAAGAAAPGAPQAPSTGAACGRGGAGGSPARGSLDPVRADGGAGGDQTASLSQPGLPGGSGYVLVLW